MATKEKKAEVIELKAIQPKIARIRIIGDSDLILNKMNDVSKRQLIDARKDKAKDVSEKPDKWEQIITSIHWLKGNPTDMSESGLEKALNPKNNMPCLTAFGLKKSFNQAVTRNNISTYSTSFDATLNVCGLGDGLIPVQFVEHHIDEKLMSPKKGKPVLVYLNRFSGWSAEFDISFLENVYSLESIVNIINLAGFGLGIGSGRTSGYGRYHVDNVI